MSDLEHDAYVYPGQRIARNGHVLGHGQGMTLRDWFAGQALISDPGNNPNLPDDPANTSRWPDAKDLAERRAKWAYHQADAMIAARKGGDA